MKIREFLKDYKDVCEKYNLKLVGDDAEGNMRLEELTSEDRECWGLVYEGSRLIRFAGYHEKYLGFHTSV